MDGFTVFIALCFLATIGLIGLCTYTLHEHLNDLEARLPFNGVGAAPPRSARAQGDVPDVLA